jgi:His-Xaa-Ser system protein HxsD
LRSAENAQGAVEVCFDHVAASVDAIQRAAYRLCDRISLELTDEGAEYQCLLRPVREGTSISASDIESFRVEVLDEVLRERIRRETEPVRNVILALAFSEADVQGEEPE